MSPEYDSEQDPQHLKFTAGEDHLSKMIRGSEEISLTGYGEPVQILCWESLLLG